jgi:MoaA/NifB/PqqE/SkfB family radical SAM enzyme
MSNTGEVAGFNGARTTEGRKIAFFKALVRKASLVNILEATDKRIIAFLLHHRLFRAAIMVVMGKIAVRYLEREPGIPRAVRMQRIAMGRALVRSIAGLFSGGQGKPAIEDAWIQRVLPGLMKNVKGMGAIWESFHQQFGRKPPAFLTISPTRNCNLACTGCYANSVVAPEDTLDFDVFERILEEKKTLWGSWFTVISGGEPLMYRSQGKTIFDIFERHPDNFFLMFTNGTLINEENARRLAAAGNVTPAISVEGYEEQTDARRGKGTYARILAAFENLRRHGVPYGVSVTAFRENASVIDGTFFDRYTRSLGALYVWIFQYMPIGRQQTLDLVITPEQRLKMYRDSWEAVSQKKIFVVDFWNSAEASEGCISGGRPYGYMYIDWHANLTPCVFVPYSPVNIADYYREGKTLNDGLQHPFFKAIHAWQKDYSLDRKPDEKGNYLTPCPIRDHYADMLKMLKDYKPRPIDASSEEALRDENYQKGMAEYDKQLSELLDPIWERGTIAPEKAMKAR